MPSLLAAIFEEMGVNDRQAKEALFLTFNVDLGYFEDRLLGPVRSAGAAVTVVADAANFAPDPRSVRSAGRSYALGLAATPRSFHPKLTVLVGPERALVGIGSGNLTIGGWHANDEVLTVIRASRQGGAPTILHGVVRFLRVMATRVTMGSVAADGVTRTADQLAALLDGADPLETGHVLVDSLTGPIAEQLPADELDALEVSAPFHDLGARALGSLITRYQVADVTVLAQQGWAEMDPESMRQVAEQASCSLSFVEPASGTMPESRYRHGKVVTGLRHGSPRWTMVGSPNLSAAALLRGFPHGNVELAVVHREGTSLLPRPTSPVRDVAALKHMIVGQRTEVDESGQTAGTPVLLEVRTIPQGVEVTLSSKAVVDLTVEVSRYGNPPDWFDDLGVLPAGRSSMVFDVQVEPGSRVRIGQQYQFVASVKQVLTRIRRSVGSVPNADVSVSEMFADPEAAKAWYSGLVALIHSHSAAGLPGVVASGSTSEERVSEAWRSLDDPDTWNDYCIDALERLGLPIFECAATSSQTDRAGLPLPNGAPAWEDTFEDVDEVFEEDQTAEEVDNLEEVEQTSVSGSAGSHATVNGLKFLKNLVQLMPRLGPIERVAACQVMISGTAANWWGEGEATPWFDLLAEALKSMGGQEWPHAMAARAASVAAVAMYRLREGVADDERDKNALVFHELADRVEELLMNATPALISENLVSLRGTTIVTPDAGDVIQELSLFRNSTPRKALERVLRNVMSEARIEWLGDDRLHLMVARGKPLLAATRAIGHAGDLPRVAILVSSPSRGWAIVAKVSGRRIEVEGGIAPTVFRTYDTTQPGGRRISTPPFRAPSQIDLQVLGECRIDASHLTGVVGLQGLSAAGLSVR
ncbi:hypothetical protein ACSDQ9_09190 [Aestuariimicrobium soli]|uniref:hypothetical protein n=1 Tax=Aestuariimicrobium soli TaxID=2035834 RepID=UPI003EBC5BF3